MSLLAEKDVKYLRELFGKELENKVKDILLRR